MAERKPGAPRQQKTWAEMGRVEKFYGMGCALLLVVLAVAGILWLIGTLTGGGSPSQPTDWPAIVSEIKTKEAGFVYDARYEDDFLIINVVDGTTEFGATRLACEDIKPLLASHGVGGQQFAVYLPNGQVLATGSRC